MILHADLDSFYASVEQRDDPRLRGRPVIVGAGVVLAASYEAKARGVYAPMGGRQALALCPDAVVVSPRFDAYTEASKAVFAIFDRTSPVVEGISIDEAFLDVGGLVRLAGEPVVIAARLRREVREQVGLPITVGIARTKHLAKVASAAAKPDGLLLVSPGSEDAFLHPLPVQKLWGVGPKTTEKLHRRGITHVRDLARLGEGPLVSMLGPHAGRHLYALATNRDPRHVVVGRRRRSIGSQCAIGWRDHTLADIDATLVGIVDRVTRRMRAADRIGRTVTLRLRFTDSSRATRATTLLHPTANTDAVLAAARELLSVAWPLIESQGCTLVGLSVGNLGDRDTVQLALPFEKGSDRVPLDDAVDDLRERFGGGAVKRAVLLGRDTGMSVPMLPD